MWHRYLTRKDSTVEGKDALFYSSIQRKRTVEMIWITLGQSLENVRSPKYTIYGGWFMRSS